MTLARLKAAAEAKRTADLEYRSAVLAALADASYAEVARAAGVSRQAVHQLAKRATTDVERIRTRLEVLDKRWSDLVEWRAGGYVLKTAAGVTAYRNAQAKKRAKRGLPRLRTVREEAFALAESELLQLLAEGTAVEGFDVEVVRAELAEADTLRGLLEPAGDGIPF